MDNEFENRTDKTDHCVLLIDDHELTGLVL
jgi:hypothetical protein